VKISAGWTAFPTVNNIVDLLYPEYLAQFGPIVLKEMVIVWTS